MFIKLNLLLVICPLVIGNTNSHVNQDNDGGVVDQTGHGGGRDGGNHDGDSDINIGTINYSLIMKNNEHIKHILANLMSPLNNNHNESLIFSEKLIARGSAPVDHLKHQNFNSSASSPLSLLSVTHDDDDDANSASNYFDDSTETTKGADIEMMRKTMVKLFSKARYHRGNVTHKEYIRSKILDRLSIYTSETFCQEFTTRDDDGVIKGVNIIGILPGKLRGEHGESVLVVGAHYDTKSNCPGVDDNGSGTMAVLETARLLSAKMGQLNHTIIFVAFDLEELGILGSIAFVNEYLIPKVLNSSKVKFLGAYVMDMILNYDPSVNAQILPIDITRAAPEAASWVRRNNYMGDFVAVWSRRQVDWHLWYTFEQSFKKLNSPPNNHKILVMDPPIPRTPLLFDNYLYRNFLRSDHAAFWNHKNRAYTESLNAVLITDMGPWRGVQRACYHEFCDDESQLTTYNLEFVKHIVDALVLTLVTFAL